MYKFLIYIYNSRIISQTRNFSEISHFPPKSQNPEKMSLRHEIFEFLGNIVPETRSGTSEIPESWRKVVKTVPKPRIDNWSPCWCPSNKCIFRLGMVGNPGDPMPRASKHFSKSVQKNKRCAKNGFFGFEIRYVFSHFFDNFGPRSGRFWDPIRTIRDPENHDSGHFFSEIVPETRILGKSQKSTKRSTLCTISTIPENFLPDS